MNEALTADLFTALDIVVMERIDNGAFKVIGAVPEWLGRLYPYAALNQDGLRLGEGFAFLDNFLIDAEAYWEENSAGWLKSGMWIETDPWENEIQLEATAVCLGNRRILLIEFLNLAYEEKRSLLQKARESSLLYQRLVRTEQALRKSEAKNRALLDAIPDSMSRIGADGVFLDFKPQPDGDAVSAKDMVGKRVNDVLPPELAQSFMHNVEQTLRQGQTQMFEYQLQSQEDRRHYEARLVISGEEEVLAIVRDITDRKRAEAKLEETLVQLKQSRDELKQSRDDMISILNQLRLGTAMTDQNGEVTFLSKLCQQFLGKSQQQVLGKKWEQVFPFPQHDREQLNAMSSLPPQQRTKVLVQVSAPEAGRRWLEIEVQDDPRHRSRKIFFFYDVSEVHDLRRLLDEKVQFHDLVGKSKPMQLVYQQIREVARVDSIVLIEGETGTGKELVARAIHYSSHRKEKPFIAVNCAGMTESLVASQLFGHKRGAFTGAIADHQGLFEAANRGTLFLDEIGDVPMSVQTNLLRVLQEKEITRLGETRPRKIDVRVLAATHRNLREEVEKGNFRVDLLYRIRVARIQLPTLGQRREDIPPLVEFFLRQNRAATGKIVQDISHEAMRIVLGYPWPGNVRELKSAIEFAVIRCKGSVIQISDLPPELIDAAYPHPPSSGDLPDEKQRLLDALQRTKGNRTVAARLLGISRATLYRRLERLGIPSNK